MLFDNFLRRHVADAIVLRSEPAHLPDGSTRWWDRTAIFEAISPKEPRFRTERRKVGKKVRTLSIPNEAMRYVHENLIAWLGWRFEAVMTSAQGRDLIPVEPHSHPVDRFATCGKRGDSPIRNILRHSRGIHFLQEDIKDAYGSVTPERLAKALLAYFPGELRDGLFDDDSRLIALLRRYFFAKEGGLSTGGPASVLLFNVFAAYWIDWPIWNALEQHRADRDARASGWAYNPPVEYTRYIDNLDFSSSEALPEHLGKLVRDTLARCGMRVSDHKATRTDIRKQAVFITGIGMDHRGGRRLFIGQRYTHKVIALMHRVITGMPLYNTTPVRIQGMAAAIRFVARTNWIVAYHGLKPHTTRPKKRYRTQLERKFYHTYRAFLRAMQT